MSMFYLIVCLCVCVPHVDHQVVGRAAAFLVSIEGSNSDGWAVRTRLYNPSSDLEEE